MAKKLAQNVRFYYGGYDPGLSTTRVEVGLEAEVLDPTAIVDTAERALAGERKDAIIYAGLFDDGSDDLDAAQVALLATGTAVASVLIGTVVGNPAYSGTAYLLSAKPAASRGELVKMEATFKPDQAIDKGKLLTAKATFTGLGTGSVSGTVADGAGSTAGYTWYVHVFSYTGAGTGEVYFETATGTAFVTAAYQGTINSRGSYRIPSVSGTSLLLANVRVRGTFFPTSDSMDIAVIYKRG